MNQPCWCCHLYWGKKDCFMALAPRKLILSPLHIALSKQRKETMLGEIGVYRIPEDLVLATILWLRRTV